MSCRFELHELRCVDCRKPTGNLGTCDDVEICAACRQRDIEIGAADEKEMAEIQVWFAEICPLPLDERTQDLLKAMEKEK